jgi:tetratricopeptide (TPR) repeat protein
MLSTDEARELLVSRLGADRVAAEPAAVQAIIDLCERLPLALAVVCARAAIRPRFPLAAVADELRDRDVRLDGLARLDPITDVRGAFLASYRVLTSAGKSLFRLLGLHPGPDISTAAAASIAGLPERTVRSHLTELAHASLVVEHAPERYALHDLVRAFANDLASACESEQARRTAIRRLVDHYLHTGYAANRLLQPHREPITLTAPEAGTTAEAVTDHEHAMAWFTVERNVLLAMVNHAAEAELHDRTWMLAWTLGTYLDRQGYWREWAAVQEVALTAAQRSGDTAARVHAHRHLAGAYTRLDRPSDALAHYQHAFDLQARSNDVLGQARGRFDLGWATARQGLHVEAIHHTQHARELYRAAGHRRGEAQALNTLGWCHAQLGDYPEATSQCQQALAIFVELGDRVWQAATLDSLGYANQQLHCHTTAITCYEQALELLRQLGDRYEEADTLTRLGESYSAAGNPEAASAAWHTALTILDELDHPAGNQLRTKLVPG